MLIKVDAQAALGAEIQGVVQIFRGRIVDVGPGQLMIEISGQEKKIEAFIEAVRPYGIREVARTGRIALVRGNRLADSLEALTPTPLCYAQSSPSLVAHSHLY